MNPSPKGGGKDCEGDSVKTEICTPKHKNGTEILCGRKCNTFYYVRKSSF